MRIGVTDHAMWRAAERFPRFDTLLIEGEVRAALKEGRVARNKPPAGFGYIRAGFYAWTPDGERCYALDADEGSFVVVTTMRADRSRGYTARPIREGG